MKKMHSFHLILASVLVTGFSVVRATEPAVKATASESAATTAPAGEMKVAAPKARASQPTVKPPPLEYLEKKPLTIAQGGIHMLPIKGKVVRIAMGSGTVVSSTAVDDHLLLIGEQVGVTTMMVWTDRVVHSYRVEVVPKDLEELRMKLDAFTLGMSGISVKQVGSEFVISGTAHKDAIAQLTKAVGDTPGVKLSISEDGGRPFTRSVLFRLHFIEVKKSLIEKIGIDWAKEAQGPVFGGMIQKGSGIYANPAQASGDNLLDPNPSFVSVGNKKGGVFLGLATTIASRINLGISNGDIRILASPELTAKSGGQAKMQVGGEVPIPIAAGLGTVNVVFKPYGVQFSIEPYIDANNIITARISTELSQIDPAVTVGGIPGFLSRSTSTEVSLQPGEMVALSGLVLSEISDAVDRVPGLSKVPVFGRLFQSQDFRDRKTELIVLLEPEIINAGDGLAQQLKARGLNNIKDFEKRVQEQQEKNKMYEPRPREDDAYSGGN